MAKTPPFYPQETDFSCAVACLRMVLDHLGVSKTEAELREICDCTIFGTAALELVLAARRLGFAASSKHTLTLSDPMELTEHGHVPSFSWYSRLARRRQMFIPSLLSPQHANASRCSIQRKARDRWMSTSSLRAGLL